MIPPQAELAGTMANVFKYDKMVENALRGVLREALIQTAERGLPGAHHFYITFRTAHPGVDIPEHLHGRFPDEMTIVIQHQFWGLEVTDTYFEVTLSFNRVNERLHIPFAAVTAFADPSAKFGLQFTADMSEQPAQGTAPVQTLRPAAAVEASDDTAEKDEKTDKAEKGQVITLDAFRKK